MEGVDGDPGNPEVQQAQLNQALSVPTYLPPEKIDIPEAWLHYFDLKFNYG